MVRSKAPGKGPSITFKFTKEVVSFKYNYKAFGEKVVVDINVNFFGLELPSDDGLEKGKIYRLQRLEAPEFVTASAPKPRVSLKAKAKAKASSGAGHRTVWWKHLLS